MRPFGGETSRPAYLCLVLAVAVLSVFGGAATAALEPPPHPVNPVRLGLEEWQIRFEESLKEHPGLVYSAHVAEKLVALTVDDGPDPRFTPAILAILEGEKVPATFFVVGRNVALYPELVRREVRDGDEVGNHTYSHPMMEGVTAEETAQEITRGEVEIEAATGRRALYFRPPRGTLTRREFQAAQAGGFRVILWSVALEHHALLTPEAMADRVIRLTTPGAIILLHDGRLDRSKSVEALPRIIKELKHRGYRFVTVSELLAHGRDEHRPPVRPLARHWTP